MKFILALCTLILSVSLGAQAAHSVILTATDPDTSSSNPGTVTFYKFTGSCPASGIPNGTALASPVSMPGFATYTDTALTAGHIYCYYATVTTGGGGSTASSNTVGFLIQIRIPTLTITAN